LAALEKSGREASDIRTGQIAGAPKLERTRNATRQPRRSAKQSRADAGGSSRLRLRGRAAEVANRKQVSAADPTSSARYRGLSARVLETFGRRCARLGSAAVPAEEIAGDNTRRALSRSGVLNQWNPRACQIARPNEGRLNLVPAKRERMANPGQPTISLTPACAAGQQDDPRLDHCRRPQRDSQALAEGE
jgi:hypothetical protein